ncbi:MAG: hypothetical protein ACI4MV_01090 [Christensenellales bacterium]
MYFMFPPKQVIFLKWQLGVHLAYIQVGSADASPKPSARPNKQSGQTEIKGSDGAGVRR